MSDRNARLRKQCESRIESKSGVNYAEARACYGRAVADEIFHELHKANEKLAFVTWREHKRLVEWKETGDKRKNGIIRNIIEGTLADEAA